MKNLDMENPLVSVIIPNYNYAQYLKQRIESVLGQTFQNFELILLDDASTDNSQEIIESYACDNHVAAVVLNTDNTGSPFPQWDKGISLAKGKYIWIAESDDYADIHFLEKTVALLESHPDVSVCYTGSNIVDSQGKDTGDDWDGWPDSPPDERIFSIFDGNEYIRHNLCWRSYIYNASSALFRAAAVRQIISDYKQMKYCGDWFFWIEIARRGNVMEIYQKLNYFRQHQDRTTLKSLISGDNLIEDMRVVKHVESIIKLGWYRKTMVRGQICKRIKRSHLRNAQERQRIQRVYANTFGRFNGYMAYGLERINKLLSPYIPWLITIRKDRL